MSRAPGHGPKPHPMPHSPCPASRSAAHRHRRGLRAQLGHRGKYTHQGSRWEHQVTRGSLCISGRKREQPESRQGRASHHVPELAEGRHKSASPEPPGASSPLELPCGQGVLMRGCGWAVSQTGRAESRLPFEDGTQRARSVAGTGPGQGPLGCHQACCSERAPNMPLAHVPGHLEEKSPAAGLLGQRRQACAIFRNFPDPHSC